MYDMIARALHDELVEYDPLQQGVRGVAPWNAVRGVAAALCAVFDSDPNFDHERFLGIVMNGWKNADV